MKRGQKFTTLHNGQTVVVSFFKKVRNSDVMVQVLIVGGQYDGWMINVSRNNHKEVVS
jgi:hypothetical protein